MRKTQQITKNIKWSSSYKGHLNLNTESNKTEDLPPVPDGKKFSFMVNRRTPIQRLISNSHRVRRPGRAPAPVVPWPYRHRPASLLQHGAAEILVSVIRRLVVVPVRVIGRIIARPGGPERLTTTRIAPPAGGAVGRQPHAARGPRAPHVRVS